MSEPTDPYRAPEAPLVRETTGGLGGSIEDTLAGHADLDVQGVLSEAWDRLTGIKGVVLVGWFAALALAFVGTVVLSIFLSEWLTQVVVTVALYPIFAGIFMAGLRHSVELPVDASEPFNYFGQFVPIALAGVLTSLATSIGMFLLILPGLYLAIALSLTIPLVVEKGLTVIDALSTSLRLINCRFVSVLLLVLASGLVLIAAAFTVIGLIWAIPWVVMVYAITYRQLAGVDIPR